MKRYFWNFIISICLLNLISSCEDDAPIVEDILITNLGFEKELEIGDTIEARSQDTLYLTIKKLNIDNYVVNSSAGITVLETNVKNKFKIITEKEGTAAVVIRKSNMEVYFPFILDIKNRKIKYTVLSSKAIVDAPPSIQNELNDSISSFKLGLSSSYILEYTQYSQTKKGILQYIPASLYDLSYSDTIIGTFTDTTVNNQRYFMMSYNDSTRCYSYTCTETGSSNNYFIEDFTTIYQEAYPSETINSVYIKTFVQTTLLN